jgi:hypothetical protein
MRKFVLVVLALLVAGGVAFSQEAKTIKGEVIDVSCYVMEGAKGMAHKDCAVACMKAGQPAGILEDGTGNVYVVVTADHLTNPATKVLPYTAKMVEVIGTVNEKGGARTIDIKSIKEVEMTQMGKK